MIVNTKKVDPPLVSDQEIVDVHIDTVGHPYDEKTVCNCRRWRRFRPKRVENEFLDIVGQRPAFSEDVPSVVKKDVTHPRMMWSGEDEVIPAHGFGITEDAIDNAESCFQVRVVLVMPTSHNCMPPRDRFEHGLVGFVTNASALNGEVEEGLGTEISFPPEFWDNSDMPG